MFNLPSAARLFCSLAITTAVLQGCGRLIHAKGNEKVGGDATDTLILGDSLSTGIFTSPRFSLDYGSILSQASKGERANPTGILGRSEHQPVRVRKPEEEVSNLGKATGPLAAEALLKVIEWPELSWGNILSNDLQTPPGGVLIAARNGAQAEKAGPEIDSWVADIKGNATPRLPNEAYVFFSGDDLCRNEAEQDRFTSPEDFVGHLRDGVRRLAQVGAANPRGTTVYLVSHLDILQLVTDPAVLGNKRIHINDRSERDLSCLDFVKEFQHRKISERPEDKLLAFTYNPMNVCYNVLAHASGLNPSEALVPLAKLRATIQAYRDGLKKLADELQGDSSLASVGIKVKLITTTNDLRMQSEDVANDCFHLSNIGQEKLAKAISQGR